MSNKFLCSACGACCMEAGGKYGLPKKKDGSCGYLTKENICSIYEDRPDVCKTEKLYELFKHKLTKKEYYIETTKGCHMLIDKHKLDSSYKINLKKYVE